MMYNISIMKKRVNYILTDEQHRILRIVAAYHGISASKLLRQIIDGWVQANVSDAKKLEIIQGDSYGKSD